MNSDGFIPVWRSFFSHYLWQEPREFSKAEAWIDLIQSANFAAGKRMIKVSLVNVPRGGIVASERFLSDRWRWSRTKVRAFLDLLEADHMIRREKDHENTIIIIVNYETYNNPPTTEEPQKNHRKTRGEPPEDQRKQGEQGEQGNKDGDESPSPGGAGAARLEKLQEKKLQLRALAVRIGDMMRRKPETGWSEKEKKALAGLFPIPEADLLTVERYYTASIPADDDRRRLDVLTLLNNWPGEVDRANRYARSVSANGLRPADATFLMRPLSREFLAWKEHHHPEMNWVCVGDVPEHVRSNFSGSNNAKIAAPKIE